MTHTPGPWKRCGADRGGCKCGHIWSPDGNQHVATAHHSSQARPDDLEAQEVWTDNPDEAKANARLIAAAPDLLEVAQAYERWEADLIIDNSWDGSPDGMPTLTVAQYDRLIEIQALRNKAIAKATVNVD